MDVAGRWFKVVIRGCWTSCCSISGTRGLSLEPAAKNPVFRGGEYPLGRFALLNRRKSHATGKPSRALGSRFTRFDDQQIDFPLNRY